MASTNISSIHSIMATNFPDYFFRIICSVIHSYSKLLDFNARENRKYVEGDCAMCGDIAKL